MSLRLVNDLQALSLSDYEDAIATYSSACIAVPGVQAIYQFGAVGAPGFSDLDLIVVLDDSVSAGSNGLRELSIEHERWRSDRAIRGCFVHDVFVCTRATFSNIDWIIPGNAWRRVAGADIERNVLTQDERELTMLVHGLDFCIGRLHEFARLEHGQCSARWLLPQLWSLTHTQRILIASGAALSPSWDDVIGALERLRATPIGNLTSAAIAHVYEPVRAHFALAAGLLLQVLAHRALFPSGRLLRDCAVASYANRALQVYHRDGVGSDELMVSATLLERRVRVGRRSVAASWTRVDLPETALTHHLAYIAADARYEIATARLARRCLAGPSLPMSRAYHTVVGTRARIVRDNDHALRALQLPFGRLTIPGLPVPPVGGGRKEGTWRLRAIRSVLDWRSLPSFAVAIR